MGVELPLSVGQPIGNGGRTHVGQPIFNDSMVDIRGIGQPIYDGHRRHVGQPIYDGSLANRRVAYLQRDPVKASCSIGDGDIPLNCVMR